MPDRKPKRAILGLVRHPRIKVLATEGEAVYHCISRTVNGERLFDEPAREIFRRQMWQVAEFCGVQIMTYTVMSNHFHVLVRVPMKKEVSDAELLRRYEVLYPKPTKYQAERIRVIQTELTANGPKAVAWRRRQLALMGDVSMFMKLLKQRFSIWYNKTHRRFGTLWAERFKSVLVEGRNRILQTVAAYIDLNCVRAGLVSDPKDYRFCGYAEAVAGSAAARFGIRSAVDECDWEEAQAHYRKWVFATGATPREGLGAISEANLTRVLTEGGKLPLAVALRCRLRYFTDGAVLGSRAFVELQLARYQEKTGRRKRAQVHFMPASVAWGDLATLRGLRHRTIV